MLSLYIHIPFCANKCTYCSFNSLAISQLENSEALIIQYVEALKKEIDHYAEILTNKQLKTLYFWWGTPSRIGIERIIDIIEYIKTKFDCEDLAELSIELNPYPEEEVLNFVKILNKKYNKISRLRYSFGIQSFDDEILRMTWRGYVFSSIVDFLRALVQLKQENNVLNFDFIAFGKFQISKNGFKQLWHEFKRDFLQKFLASWYVDSVSLYTLEGLKDKQDGLDKKLLLTGLNQSQNQSNPSYHGNDNEIMEEFLILKDMIEDEWFMRYEISNFASASKASIHNIVYWNMEPYLWLWVSASSFIPRHSEAELKNIYPSLPSGWQAMRWTNTWDIKKYIEWNRIDKKEIQILNESDFLIEEFFLRLRTREGIADLGKFTPVLVPNYKLFLETYTKEWLVIFDWVRLKLTDSGMNVYNSIVTDLLEKL